MRAEAQAHIDQINAATALLRRFLDWDRCRTLRQQLVDAYMGSVWPPHELLLVADSVGELDSVMQILGMRYQGASYISRILSDARLLPPEIFKRFERRAPKEDRRKRK